MLQPTLMDIDVKSLPTPSGNNLAIPSRNGILAIKNFIGNDKVFEVGSMSGMWGFLLREEGVDVQSIESLNRLNTRNVLLISWSVNTSTKYFRGKKIIYIGNASDVLSLNSNWKLVHNVCISELFRTNDYAKMYIRD